MGATRRRAAAGQALQELVMSGYLRFLRLMTAVVLGSFAAAAALADDPLVYATIQPAQIALGESAQFTITNLGDATNPIITLPVVSVLRFEIIGRTREMQIFNGTLRSSSSFVMPLTPHIHVF